MSRRLVPLALASSIVGISISGPLVRLSHAEPLAIAVWRMGFTLAIVAAVTLVTGTWTQWRTLARGDLLAGVGAGAFLALHLWSWIVSVGMTSVAASVVLVNIHPIVVALGSALWLGEKPGRKQIIGIAITLGGAALLALSDASLGGANDVGRGMRALDGDLLAVLGAVALAFYLLLGRRLRRTLDVWPYVTLVYGACLAILFALARVRNVTLTGEPPRELGLFLAMALGPGILGHTAYNWALRHVRAYVVSIAVLGEPVGATLIAAAVPAIAEIPTPLTLIGGAVILSGILLTAWQD